MNLNDRETATVLAALRHFQYIDSDAMKDEHFTDVEPLNNNQIDELCERINTDYSSFVCENPECKLRGQPQDSILIESKCTQTLTMAGDQWENTEVGETIAGYCQECAHEIPKETLTQLTDRAGGL